MRHSRGRRWAGLAALSLAAGLVVGPVDTARAGAPASSQVFDAFDPERPGYGLDIGCSGRHDHDMAWALYAIAAAGKGRLALLRRAADHLVEVSDRGGGRWGWGVPCAWDACEPGPADPVGTIYGITVAWAVRALRTAWDLTGTKGYRRTARRALDYYAGMFHLSEDEATGYFSYSDQPADADCNAFNVSAMLAAEYAWGAVELHSARDGVMADLALAGVWSGRQSSELGVYWPYRVGAPNLNDAVHHALILDGFLEARSFVPSSYPLEPALAYLALYVQRDRVSEQVGSTRYARLWGVGMAIDVLARSGRVRAASVAADSLPRYALPGRPFRYAQRPGETAWYPRQNAYLLLGLIRLEQHI